MDGKKYMMNLQRGSLKAKEVPVSSFCEIRDILYTNDICIPVSQAHWPANEMTAKIHTAFTLANAFC